jgi:hypothetical protein
MTFEEYQLTGRTRHCAFVDVIPNILRQALDQHDLLAHILPLQAAASNV